MHNKIANKEAVVGIVGLGAIGLTLANAFGQAGFQVRGCENNIERSKLLQAGRCHLNYFNMNNLNKLAQEGRFVVSEHMSVMDGADAVMICVPTPLTRHRMPDLSVVKKAASELVKYIKKGQLIVLQSSTYPGTTEEILVPIFEQSGLKAGVDFYLAHVPEVEDVGNASFDASKIPHIIGGITPESTEIASQLYMHVGHETFKCSSVRIAESAKLLQNTYRLINISLVNELKIMFERMDIDIWEVIAAASTKPFGYTPFYPGPGIGGECIPVVPLYLSWQAEVTDGPSRMIELAAHINTQMPHYVVERISVALNTQKKSLQGSNILVLGAAYKKDVNDIRESPSLKIISLLKEQRAIVSYNDPFVSSIDEIAMKSVDFDAKSLAQLDCVLIAVDHSAYDWPMIAQFAKLIVDTRNVTQNINGSKTHILRA